MPGGGREPQPLADPRPACKARPGDLDADRETIDAASRHVRGASHAQDIPALLATGHQLLVIAGRGWAAARDGWPAIVAARRRGGGDRPDVVGAWPPALPGAPVHIDFITQGNDWAVALALDAGLSLTPDGPTFVRGELGPLAPYLPSGAYL